MCIRRSLDLGGRSPALAAKDLAAKAMLKDLANATAAAGTRGFVRRFLPCAAAVPAVPTEIGQVWAKRRQASDRRRDADRQPMLI